MSAMDLALEQMLERHGHAAPPDVEAIREGLLARFQTRYARALRSGMEHFCERLAAAGDVPCGAWLFAFAGGRWLLFFENARTGELLGVLHTSVSGSIYADE